MLPSYARPNKDQRIPQALNRAYHISELCHPTDGASRLAARLHARETDCRTLHTGKPTGQRRARATTASELSPGSTLDGVIGLLNVIVAQNDRLTGRNEELGDGIRRLRGALETSEEMQYPALAQLLGIGHFRLEPVCKPYLRHSPVYEINWRANTQLNGHAAKAHGAERTWKSLQRLIWPPETGAGKPLSARTLAIVIRHPFQPLVTFLRFELFVLSMFHSFYQKSVLNRCLITTFLSP